jgi:adenine/guanine phosphoribosyltransferase-like PRPP-binding protein
LSRRKNVLLVDDIFATGATANEVAKTFKTAGAEKIYIFTLGRVIVVKGLDNELEKWIGNLGKLKQYG